MHISSRTLSRKVTVPHGSSKRSHCTWMSRCTASDRHLKFRMNLNSPKVHHVSPFELETENHSDLNLTMADKRRSTGPSQQKECTASPSTFKPYSHTLNRLWGTPPWTRGSWKWPPLHMPWQPHALWGHKHTMEFMNRKTQITLLAREGKIKEPTWRNWIEITLVRLLDVRQIHNSTLKWKQEPWVYSSRKEI